MREHQTALSAAHAAGRQAWGGLALSSPLYAERVLRALLRRAHASGADPEAALGELLQRAALTDLFLAIACDEGIDGAWERFQDGFHARLVAIARRRRLPGVTAEEVVADLTGTLLAPPAGGQGRTRMGTYDGTGSMLGWLTAILMRDAADRCRSGPGTSRAECAPAVAVLPLRDGALADPAVTTTDTPLTAAIGAETARELRAALHRVWGQLTPQQALVLLLRFRDGVAQTQIAKMLAVSESRVSRVLASAVDLLRTGLGSRLEAWRAADPERLWRALHDELGLRLQESVPPADHRTVRRLS